MPDCHRKGCEKPAIWRVGFSMPEQSVARVRPEPLASWINVAVCSEHKRSLRTITDVLSADVQRFINDRRLKRGKAPLDFDTCELRFRKLDGEESTMRKTDDS